VTSGESPARRILHVDADAFFVAVARMEDPVGAGANPLLIVGGRTRGVVCSASYETRAFGVRSAMPISTARRLCPGALCVPVPFAACRKKSREIASVLRSFTPVVQSASIDEWYLDLSGTETLYGGASLETVGHRIRHAVHDATGLWVSLGGGTNRLISKLAVERAKPKPGTTANGVHVVGAGGERAFMRTVALADIPMVGPVFRGRLEAAGLRTIPDVLKMAEADLNTLLGVRAAEWLSRRAQGVDDSDVRERGVAKSLGHEETFAEDIADDIALRRELLHLVTRVMADLRGRGLHARTVTVKIKDYDFRTRGASRALAEAVATDRVVLDATGDLLLKLRRKRRVPVRLLGVSLSGLGEGHVDAQLSLFSDSVQPDAAETPKDRALAKAVDRVREKFGRDAMLPAGLTGRKER
jgi:DNA polymerase-4